MGVEGDEDPSEEESVSGAIEGTMRMSASVQPAMRIGSRKNGCHGTWWYREEPLPRTGTPSELKTPLGAAVKEPSNWLVDICASAAEGEDTATFERLLKCPPRSNVPLVTALDEDPPGGAAAAAAAAAVDAFFLIPEPVEAALTR